MIVWVMICVWVYVIAGFNLVYGSWYVIVQVSDKGVSRNSFDVV